MRLHLPLTITLLALCACAPQTSLQPATPIAQGAPTADTSKTGRLFVSEPDNGDVYLYDIPTFRLITILQTFKRPQGECSDFDGNVWVADAGTRKVVKIDYAGKTIGRLSDRNGAPYSCAWDGSTGDLAVTSTSERGYAGAVLIYKQAMGTPITIRDLQLRTYAFDGYDRSGDLFFDGKTFQGKFQLSEVSAHQKYAHTVSVKGTKIYSAGFVQWDATRRLLDVGDQNCGGIKTTCVYQMQVNGKTAQVVGEINLRTYRGSKVCDVVQAAVFSGNLYGSDDERCGYADGATYDWRYPGGGAPKQTAGKALATRFGATVAPQT